MQIYNIINKQLQLLPKHKLKKINQIKLAQMPINNTILTMSHLFLFSTAHPDLMMSLEYSHFFHAS